MFLLGDIFIIQEPKNVTVLLHGNVSFCCTYNGTTLVASWIINNTIYNAQDIPPGYTYVIGEEYASCLLIKNVTIDFNSTTYQCSIPTIFHSNIGLLLIDGELIILLFNGV